MRTTQYVLGPALLGCMATLVSVEGIPLHTTTQGRLSVNGNQCCRGEGPGDAKPRPKNEGEVCEVVVCDEFPDVTFELPHAEASTENGPKGVCNRNLLAAYPNLPAFKQCQRCVTEIASSKSDEPGACVYCALPKTDGLVCMGKTNGVGSQRDDESYSGKCETGGYVVDPQACIYKAAAGQVFIDFDETLATTHMNSNVGNKDTFFPGYKPKGGPDGGANFLVESLTPDQTKAYVFGDYVACNAAPDMYGCLLQTADTRIDALKAAFNVATQQQNLALHILSYGVEVEIVTALERAGLADVFTSVTAESFKRSELSENFGKKYEDYADDTKKGYYMGHKQQEFDLASMPYLLIDDKKENIDPILDMTKPHFSGVHVTQPLTGASFLDIINNQWQR